MIWTCHEERPRVCKKKDDGNEVTGKEEKRETKETIFRCSERRYGGIGWSENNFFFEIEKSVVLKTCQTGKIYEKNWFWRVATFGGLATPQNVF